MPRANYIYPTSGKLLAGRRLDPDTIIPQFAPIQVPGQSRSHATPSEIDASVAEDIYAMVGVRAKPLETDLVISLTFASVLSTTNDRFEWIIYANPTVAGTFTWTDHPDSRTQVATGDATTTVTDGIPLVRSYGEGNATAQAQFANELDVGPEDVELVLAVSPLTINADYRGSLVWRELD